MNKQGFDICYVISHGFAARMFLQTGLIHKLAKENLKIAIITPDATDENFVRLSEHENITTFNSEIELSLTDDNYGFKRRYFLENIRDNPVYWEKHIYSLLYSTSKHPWKRIRPLYYYYFINRLISVFPSIRENFKATETKFLESKKIDKLISEINPKLIVASYPINFLESKALYAAQKKGITTINHLLSWDNITSKGIFPVIPDYFIAWGTIMKNEIIEYYNFPEEKIFQSGVPHFDQHIKIKNNPRFHSIIEELGLNADFPYVFFAMSSPRFAPYEIEIVEWLAKKIEEGMFGKEMQFIIRPHPQNVQGKMADSSWVKRLKKLVGGSVALDLPQLLDSKIRWSMKPADMDRLSNLLAGSRVVINSGSTVSIDALVFDKPVIITSFDADKKLPYLKSARRLIDYIHQRKFINLGGVSPVFSYRELEDEINHYLEDDTYKKEKRASAIFSQCGLQDGNATERVIGILKNLIQREGNT